MSKRTWFLAQQVIALNKLTVMLNHYSFIFSLLLCLTLNSSFGQYADNWVPVSSKKDSIGGTFVLNDTLYSVKKNASTIYLSRFDNGIWKKTKPLHVRSGENYRSLAFFQGQYYLATNSVLYTYNGSTWDSLISGPFQRIIVYNGRLLIQGNFSVFQGGPAYGFATFNGSSFDVLKTPGGQVSGVSGDIYDIKAIDGKLYVAGKIHNSQQVTIFSDLAVWNDTTWYDGFVPINNNPKVREVFKYNGKICVRLDGNGFDKLFEINGSIPSPLDSLGSSFNGKALYLNQSIQKLVEYNSQLLTIISVRDSFLHPVYQNYWNYGRRTVAYYDGVKWEHSGDSTAFNKIHATTTDLFGHYRKEIGWWHAFNYVFQYNPNAKAVDLAIANAGSVCEVDSTRLFLEAPIQTAPNGHSYYTNKSGPQTIYLSPGQPTTLYYPASSLDYYQPSSCSDTVQTVALGNKSFADAIFYVVPKTVAHDVKVHVVGTTGWRCRQGFKQNYYLLVENVGTEPLYNINVDFHFPNQSGLENSSQAPVINQTGYLGFGIDTLALGAQQTIRVKLDNPTSLIVGDTVQFKVNASLPFNDSDTTNNRAVLNQNVVAAYDPNSKLVNPETHQGWGGRMDYQINFQNLGNDTAYKVVVVDSLPTDVYPGTIRFHGSSHPYRVTMNNRYLVFEFDNILLPDSATDRDGSKGFVQFSVEMSDQLGRTDTIKNRAFIYFDFQPAVITNWAKTHYVSGFGLDENVKPAFRVSPNPSQGILEIDSPEQQQFYLYNLQGALVWQSTSKIQDLKVDLSHLPAGVYLLTGETGGIQRIVLTK